MAIIKFQSHMGTHTCTHAAHNCTHTNTHTYTTHTQAHTRTHTHNTCQVTALPVVLVVWGGNEALVQWGTRMADVMRAFCLKVVEALWGDVCPVVWGGHLWMILEQHSDQERVCGKRQFNTLTMTNKQQESEPTLSAINGLNMHTRPYLAGIRGGWESIGSGTLGGRLGVVSCDRGERDGVGSVDCGGSEGVESGLLGWGDS